MKVPELRPPVTARRGRLMHGKFDQFKKEQASYSAAPDKIRALR
jgi:hypothetical protein